LHTIMDDTEIRNAPRPVWHAWAVALLILAAIAVRLYRLHCGSLGVDGSICGLLGLNVLKGNWPIFFYGQNFMGALEGYLAAPIYAIFGPTTITLNIWAPILSFATLLVLYACLRRYMKPLPSLVALAYMAIPPAMAYWHAGKPNNHYPLGILLCALLMWLSFKLWGQRPWRSLTVFWWGLVAGLAFWTNFQTVVIIWACMIFLALTCLPRLRPLPVLSGMAGALIGGAPLIYYDAVHHWEHGAQSGSFALKYAAPHWEMMWQNALPIALGFNTLGSGGHVSPGSPWFALYIVVAALMALGLVMLLWRSFTPEGRWAILPLLVVIMSMAVLVFSIYGRELYLWDQRYLLPIYLGLPFVWAAFAQALNRWGKAAVLVFGALLLALNVSGWTQFGSGVLTCGWKSFRHSVEAKEKEMIGQLRKDGFTAAYSFDRYVFRLAFFADESPQFADPWRDRRQYAANQVDADPKAGILDAPMESIQFLGLPHKTWHDRMLHDFQPPQGADTPLSRKGWSFSGKGGFEPGRTLMDGDLRSGWRISGKQTRGQGFILDLGQPQMAGGVVLLPPSFRQTPGNLTIEAAGPDGVFRMIRKMTDAWQPLYWSAVHPFFKARYPRVECYFPPREIQYLRITQHAKRKSGHPALLGEVMLLGAPAQDGAQTGWVQSGQLVAEVVRAENIKRVYADAWLSAYLHGKLSREVWTLPANYSTDDYGSTRPSAEEPLRLDISSGSALVVPNPEAGQARAALQRVGTAFKARDAGNFTVFILAGQYAKHNQPLPLASVTSDIDPQTAAQLAKGVPDKGRWGSLTPQKPGMRLTVDLGQTKKVGRVRIWNTNFPDDFARGLALSLSEDGLVWREAQANLAAPLVFNGRGLFAVPAEYSEYALLEPQDARFVRLTLTRGAEPWWWSVERLEVFAP
jgi:hypothetical protein